MNQEIYEEIRSLCIEACRQAPSRLKIVKGEDDGNTNLVPDADEFLKLDENRIGRDFKLYNFMANVAGKADAIADFASVLMTIKSQVPEAFTAISTKVHGWEKYFDVKLREDWHKLWE